MTNAISNLTTRTREAAPIVDEQMRDLIERLARWGGGDKKVSIGELVAQARTIAGRCKRLETRHARTVAAVLREGLLTPPPGVEA